MRRCLRQLLLTGLLVSLGSVAQAQGAAGRQAASQTPAPVARLQLGQSAFALNGPWKFTIGDSPMDAGTGQPLWAEPGFDDSRWENVDLTAVHGQVDPMMGTAGYVPGWTAKGHPHYWGYGWYRIRVQVDARPGQRLALSGPNGFDDVFQVYANGRLIGGFGDFSRNPPIEFYGVPTFFELPADPQADGQGGKTLVLAVRIYASPTALATQPDAGGLHGAPFLGDAGSVQAGYRLRFLDVFKSYLSYFVQAIVFTILSFAAFGLTLFDRSDRVYLWIGAVFLLTAAYFGFVSIDGVTQHVSLVADALIADCLLTPLIFAGWAMVWWVWFGAPWPRWTPWAAASLAILLSVSTCLAEQVFFGLIPPGFAAHFETLSLIVRLAFTALLVWIAVQGIRRDGVEGWLAAPAVLLRGVASFYVELNKLHLNIRFFPFGISIGLEAIADLLLVAALCVLLLRRLLKSVRAQRELALDVKQAQEVQQVILPEARVVLPGIVIESVYRPAREVGGDFFQIIPNAEDGSLLIVAGDVAGKGLPAGMLVALLVGAIRSTCDWTSDPVRMLKALNQRLMGRGNAAATCLALRIEADGRATLANAGHLPPWINGKEAAIEGSLPLGLYAGAEPSVMQFELAPHDKLVLLSDGILEATNDAGELFGFARIQAFLAHPSTAGALADAAQAFGQNDDISVIALTFQPA